MKAKTKLTKLWSILLALVMVVGMIPIAALAEEPDAAQQFADAPGEFFYRIDGGYNSEGPTVDTIFTLTEPTMITGIWTYHWNAADYDIDFSRQTIQLKDTATNTVVYSGAVRVGHIWNERDCDWIVLPNIVLPAGTYQVIDSHNESWCALNSKGVCMVKGYSTTPSATADFSTDPTAALSLLNAAKTGTTDSTWDSDTKTLTLNGVNFETTAATAVRLPADSTIILNGVNTIKGGNSDSGDCYGIEGLGNLTIKGTGKLDVTSGTTSRTAYCSFGIRAVAVTIKSGTVIAKGGTAQMTEDSRSGGIYGSNYITIEGGIVEATGDAAWRSCGFNIVALGTMNISGGTVTATGGTSDHYSYGIYTAYSAYVNITGGSLIAKAGSAPSARALPSPDTLPDTYWWRSSDSGQYKKGSFNWGDVSTYVEIWNTEPITTYTVTFDANGGTDTMADVTDVLGDYTLPENGFTAPEGKQFKGWSVDGKEKAVGDKITVSADTTVKAVWEDITYTVNVTNGTASPSQAAAGTTVTLNANAAPDGQVFDKWVVESGSITLADASSATTTFTMPAGDVSVKATYHTHSYGSVWKSDADKHWHECTCGDKSAEAAHTAGDWIIDTPATATTDGTKHKACTACGYVMENGTIPATGYTVSFDANGGTGTMADVTGVSGTYTLPENGFTAPEGKQFKAWSVNGTEKAARDKIAVAADTTVKAVWENIPAAPTEYNILDGANSKWTQDSDGNLSVRGSGAFSEFVGVKVDGKSVDEKYYTVKEGSTIVTLKADYLNTLTVGSHTLEIVWTDGSASTAFTVSAQTVVESPQTGDNSMIWIWIALLFVSGIGVMGTIIYIRKKKYSVK